MYGLSQHKNQLAMTIVMCLPLVPLVFRRLLLPVGLYAVLLAGLNATGSRSGLIGATLVTLALVGHWSYRKPGRKGAAVAIAIGVLTLGLALAPTDTTAEDQSLAVARLFGTENTVESDAERQSQLEAAVDSLSADTLLTGLGDFTSRASHNVWLGVLVSGGVVALLGLIQVALLPARAVVRGLRERESSEVFRLALACVGFLVVVSLNNYLWAPYAWVMLATLVAALADHGNVTPASHHKKSSDRSSLRRLPSKNAMH